MKTKDILIIRLSSLYSELTPEAIDGFSFNLSNKFEGIYNIIVLNGENETTKTTFEIIKYEN